MIRSMATIALLAGILGAPMVRAAGLDVGVVISGEIQPGVYGRVEIGHQSPPPVVYAQPVWVVQPPPRVYVAPVYLHVPPGHAKNWRKYCGRYSACDRPVYFVRGPEYDAGVDYDDRRGKKNDHGRGNGRGRGHDD